MRINKDAILTFIYPYLLECAPQARLRRALYKDGNPYLSSFTGGAAAAKLIRGEIVDRNALTEREIVVLKRFSQDGSPLAVSAPSSRMQ